MSNYKDTPTILLNLFPEFVHEPTYDEADKATPAVIRECCVPQYWLQKR